MFRSGCLSPLNTLVPTLYSPRNSSVLDGWWHKASGSIFFFFFSFLKLQLIIHLPLTCTFGGFLLVLRRAWHWWQPFLPAGPGVGKQEGADTQTEEMSLTNMKKWICYTLQHEEQSAVPPEVKPGGWQDTVITLLTKLVFIINICTPAEN